MKTTIIVVSGLPGSGKSTVATWLANRFTQPVLAKDTFKETLFDELGIGDLAWSSQLSQASYVLLFAIAEELARNRIACILEGNFRWEQTHQAFESLAAHAQFKQVWCHAPSDILVARLTARAGDPSRHPGHRDAQFIPKLLAEVRDPRLSPLPLNGPLLQLDTSVDASQIENSLAQFVASD